VNYFKEEIVTIPCKNLREVFKLVETRRVDRGIVPIENSLQGSVTETYDLLQSSNLMVAGEHNLRVRHCLISHPGTTLRSIRQVYSHPQALAQCDRFLERLNVETVPTYDTAGSVKIIKEKRLLHAAAIAGRRAAEIYGMKVLKQNIENEAFNYTRFFILADQDSPPTGYDKTSISFSLPHKPGSLYRALGEFADLSINLTKLESRPTRRRPWEYHFYLDFEGHRMSSSGRQALEALRRHATSLKILGSYPAATPPQ